MAPENDCDRELLERSRNGDHGAFRCLMDKYKNRIGVTIKGMLGDCQEVDDVGQETFIRFYRSLGSFRQEACVGTYLTRIAINLSYNELKKRKRRSMRTIMCPPEEMEALVGHGGACDEKDMKDLVRLAVSRLTPKLRSVIVLRLMNGYSVKETARQLEVPVGTVLSRQTRGQTKLKDIIELLSGPVNEENNR